MSSNIQKCLRFSTSFWITYPSHWYIFFMSWHTRCNRSLARSLTHFSFVWLSENPRPTAMRQLNSLKFYCVYCITWIEIVWDWRGLFFSLFIRSILFLRHFLLFQSKNPSLFISNNIRYGLEKSRKKAAAVLDAAQFHSTSFTCARRTNEQTDDENNIQYYVVFMLGMANESKHNLELNGSIHTLYNIHMPGMLNNGKWARGSGRKCKRNAFNQISFVVGTKRRKKRTRNAPPLETCIPQSTHIHFVCRVENFRIIDCITSFGKDDDIDDDVDDDNVERIFCVCRKKWMDSRMGNSWGFRSRKTNTDANKKGTG